MMDHQERIKNNEKQKYAYIKETLFFMSFKTIFDDWNKNYIII